MFLPEHLYFIFQTFEATGPRREVVLTMGVWVHARDNMESQAVSLQSCVETGMTWEEIQS